MELQEIIGIVLFTTILTTASTFVITSKAKDEIKKSLCTEISEIKNNLNNTLVRIGVLESKLKG